MGRGRKCDLGPVPNATDLKETIMPRPKIGDRPLTNAEKQARFRAKRAVERSAAFARIRDNIRRIAKRTDDAQNQKALGNILSDLEILK